MDPPAGHNLNFKNGNRSRMRANAVKMAISIKNKIRLELIKKLPLCVYNRRHGIKSFVFYNTKKGLYNIWCWWKKSTGTFFYHKNRKQVNFPLELKSSKNKSRREITCLILIIKHYCLIYKIKTSKSKKVL